MSKYTFKQFQAEFPNDEACLAKLMEIRFGGTELTCPGCRQHAAFHPMGKRKAYACQDCGHHVYPCANTIFHKSSTKLSHWFFAMYLMTSTRHGVAAKEIERQIGVTYKTAWRMCHELRKLMATADYEGPLGGHVEIDETHVGGHQTHEDRADKGSNKTIVMGMVSRDGALRAGPIPADTKAVMEPIVYRNVEPGSTISTDMHKGYEDLSADYRHEAVDHNVKEYVRGVHHTNTIEGHWSLFKRAVAGTHVLISSKHMWKYVSEFSYRRNFRFSHRVMFARLARAVSLPRLAET
ncbi:MAG TPA: IS1595 family transposase [Roseiarcus sp.]|nr:IS1595 family transposase [Roseiarcus sp.]